MDSTYSSGLTYWKNVKWLTISGKLGTYAYSSDKIAVFCSGYNNTSEHSITIVNLETYEMTKCTATVTSTGLASSEFKVDKATGNIAVLLPANKYNATGYIVVYVLQSDKVTYIPSVLPITSLYQLSYFRGTSAIIARRHSSLYDIALVNISNGAISTFTGIDDTLYYYVDSRSYEDRYLSDTVYLLVKNGSYSSANLAVITFNLNNSSASISSSYLTYDTSDAPTSVCIGAYNGYLISNTRSSTDTSTTSLFFISASTGQIVSRKSISDLYGNPSITNGWLDDVNAFVTAYTDSNLVIYVKPSTTISNTSITVMTWDSINHSAPLLYPETNAYLQISYTIIVDNIDHGYLLFTREDYASDREYQYSGTAFNAKTGEAFKIPGRRHYFVNDNISIAENSENDYALLINKKYAIPGKEFAS